MDWLEMMSGRERARREADEQARQATREAQDRGLAARAREAPPKEPEPIQRPENERWPSERMYPDDAERMRKAHDTPPKPQQPQQEPEREATRMEYTRTAQPAPSIGSAGAKFTNSRAQQPKQSWGDNLMDQVDKELAAERARRASQEYDHDHNPDRTGGRGGRER